MQVAPSKATSKPPGTKHLKLECEDMLSRFAFKFNLRRYKEAGSGRLWHGRSDIAHHVIATHLNPRVLSQVPSYDVEH